MGTCVFLSTSPLLAAMFLLWNSRGTIKRQIIVGTTDVSETSILSRNNAKLFYSRTSTNGHLSTTARIFRPNRTLIHTLYSNWNLPTTASYFGPKVAVVERFNCIWFMRISGTMYGSKEEVIFSSQMIWRHVGKAGTWQLKGILRITKVNTKAMHGERKFLLYSDQVSKLCGNKVGEVYY